MRAFVLFAVALSLAASASAQHSAIRVSADQTRSSDEALQRADEAVRNAARNLATASAPSLAAKQRIGRYRADLPVLVPMTVRLTQGGQDLQRATATRAPGDPITLQFDTDGARALPPTYRDFLQSVFNAARPTMDLVFGAPAVGGPVRVANFDADIGDRDAVAGGYFVPNNGSGQAEIRFPIYTSPEAAAVNFIHTMLLSYLGPTPYAFDPWYEGLVRAATMRIVRTPGALPAGLDSELLESVLAISYDVGPFYDWYNQRDIGGPRFIAPNLRDVPLPAGGSIGGLYLLRYRMAGSAWQKVLVQYPTFAARLNERLYAQPEISQFPDALRVASQVVIDNIAGPGATVEGYSFREWVKRQFILRTDVAQGQKLVVEPTPITVGLGGQDFGVFLIETHYFETTGEDGNEVLLSGTSFPIFWEGESFLNRVFPSAQEDRMDIAGAYGAVVPNIPDFNAGAPYRVITDIPVQDQIARAYLPAGAVATAANPTENNLYGTVIGASGTLRIRASVGGTVVAEAPVVNGAFGVRVESGAFLGPASVLVEVVQGVDTILLSRRVNKGPGGLALDLRVNGEATFALNLDPGLNAFGMPVEPFSTSIREMLRLPGSYLLAARYNPGKASYDLFPSLEPFKIGHGYFLHTTNVSTIIEGRIHPGTPVAVALRPGWNLIAAPLLETVPTNRIQLVRATENPVDFSQALGTEIGLDFFRYVRGPADPISGLSETGSFEAATQFQPGEAYYVRVLAPEGVTLLFYPASSFAPTSTPMPSDRTRIHSRTLGATTGWRMRVQLVGGGTATTAFLGQSPTATEGFDSAEDSVAPPSIGGLRVSSQGSEPLYRDIRSLGLSGSYRLNLEGLQIGKSYVVRFSMIRGRVSRIRVQDLATGAARNLRSPGVYAFKATSTSHQLEVSMPGGAR